jgi:hypothetical protein
MDAFWVAKFPGCLFPLARARPRRARGLPFHRLYRILPSAERASCRPGRSAHAPAAGIAWPGLVLC